MKHSCQHGHVFVEVTKKDKAKSMLKKGMEMDNIQWGL